MQTKTEFNEKNIKLIYETLCEAWKRQTEEGRCFPLLPHIFSFPISPLSPNLKLHTNPVQRKLGTFLKIQGRNNHRQQNQNGMEDKSQRPTKKLFAANQTLTAHTQNCSHNNRVQLSGTTFQKNELQLVCSHSALPRQRHPTWLL